MRLLTGEPEADFARCVPMLSALIEDEGAEILASNQIIGEAYIAVQHHYGVSQADARPGLFDVLRSGLVIPLNGSAVSTYASGQDRLPKTVRFCETDLMTVHKDSFQVQRLEVVNTGRRRRWSVAEKLRIVEESFQGHRQVSATACRHDISPSLLFSWRKAFRRGRDEVIGFAPALIVPDEEAPLGAAAAVGRMEIVTVTGQRIMVGADVDVLALARVVAALEAR